MQEKSVLAGMSAEFNYSSQYAEVLGSKMHYIEQGDGDPIILLHGMPASCYLWRNIIPFIAPLGRCIAPDLIGLGKSDKPDIAYTIEDHIRYVEEFIETKKLKNVTLIMHGWGSLIGFDYAMRHEDNCKGLVFYEAFLRPLQGNDLSLPLQEQLLELQMQESKNALLLNNAYFIDTLLPQSMMHELSAQELKHYREPFEGEGANQKGVAKVLKQYWQELPRGDGKSKIDQLIDHYTKKLTKSQLPKLLLYSVPGFVTTIAAIMWAKENLPNLEIGDVGEELHFAQETRPQLMGELISAWLQSIEQQVKVR
jgi:haloalkane dehalogenase